MNPITARAQVVLDLAEDFIARADGQPEPEDPERREARARFLRAAEIVIKIAEREPIYWSGLLLPPWEVSAGDERDPRVEALEEVTRAARLDVQAVKARVRKILAEDARSLGILTGHMETLPRPRRRPVDSEIPRRLIPPITRADQLEGLDASRTGWLDPGEDLQIG